MLFAYQRIPSLRGSALKTWMPHSTQASIISVRSMVFWSVLRGMLLAGGEIYCLQDIA